MGLRVGSSFVCGFRMDVLAGLFNIGGFIFLVIWSILVGYKLWKFG